jgi:FG-GAP repeat
MATRFILAVCSLLMTSTSAVAANTYREDTQLHPDTDTPQFGFSVAIGTDEVAVVMPKQSDKPSGSVALFKKDSSGSWITDTVLPDYSEPGHDFSGYLGCNGIAVGSDTAIVGLPGANGGAGVVVVFERAPFGWTSRQVLSAPMASTFESFGCSVSLSGNLLVIGAPGHANVGAAYAFTYKDVSWTFDSELDAAGAAKHDEVGFSVAADGDQILVGAPHSNFDQGASFVFERFGSTWTQTHKLTASDGAAGDQFGEAVSLSEGKAIIGAPERAMGNGAAYVYTSDEFDQETRFSSPTDTNFGSAVGIAANRIIVGALGSSTVSAYTRSGATWYLLAQFSASSTRMGGAVAISGSTIVFGEVSLDSGAVNIFHDDDIFFHGYE